MVKRLVLACGISWCAMFGGSWPVAAVAQDGPTILLPISFVGYFDKDAPTVLAEDVAEFREREGVVAQERRNGEREDAAHKETKRRQDECFANAGAVRAGEAAAAAKPLRKDLEGKTLMELVQMQQARPDPEIEAALMQRAQADAAKVGMPGGASPLQALAGTLQRQGGPIDAKVAESLRRQEQAASPAVQACLAAAEVKPMLEPVKHIAFDSGAFLDAIDNLRQSRGAATSVVVRMADTIHEDERQIPGEAQRFNVVSRAGPRAGLAVPLARALPASFRPNGKAWPSLTDAQKLAESVPVEPEAPKKKPTTEGFMKSAKELLDQLKGVPR